MAGPKQQSNRFLPPRYGSLQAGNVCWGNERRRAAPAFLRQAGGVRLLWGTDSGGEVCHHLFTVQLSSVSYRAAQVVLPTQQRSNHVALLGSWKPRLMSPAAPHLTARCSQLFRLFFEQGCTTPLHARVPPSLLLLPANCREHQASPDLLRLLDERRRRRARSVLT